MSDAEEFADEGGDGPLDPYFKPSFVLVALDAHPSMFVKTENEDDDDDSESTPFNDTLSVCHDIAESLIFNKNKRSFCSFGVVVATDDPDAASLVNFKDNLLDSIRLLGAKSETPGGDLEVAYRRKGPLDLAAFFLLCKKKFKEISSAFYRRTILFVTNDDDPTMGDANLRFTALNEARNFEAGEIEFELVTSNASFDYTKFYNEMFSLLKHPGVENLVEDRDGLRDKLSSAILLKHFHRKMLFYPFQGQPKRFLKVVEKRFIRGARLYNNAHALGDGTEVRKLRRPQGYIDETSYCVRHRHGELELGIEEAMDVRNTDLEIGYHLLFVSDRVTEAGVSAGKTAILEADPKEGLAHFEAMWQHCVDHGKVLVCARKRKYQDKIRFVEFVPKFGNNNSRSFTLKTIPFRDELAFPRSSIENRKYDPTERGVAEKKALIDEVIDELTFDYDAHMFSNPMYAAKAAFVKAKLLGQVPKQSEDVTNDTSGIDERLGPLGQRFRNVFGLDEDSKGGGRKRRGGAAGGRGAKKLK